MKNLFGTFHMHCTTHMAYGTACNERFSNKYVATRVALKNGNASKITGNKYLGLIMKLSAFLIKNNIDEQWNHLLS